MSRPKKTASNSTRKTTRNKKTTTAVKAVETPVEEVKVETAVETPVEEVKAEKAVETPVEEVKAEKAVEIPVEEVKAEKAVESKPKRKYTRKAKKEEEKVIPVKETPAEIDEKPVQKSAEIAEKPVQKSSEINVFIQGAGAEKSLEELADTAKKLSGVKSPKSVNLYIKPYEEDGTAKVYYVVDNKAGHFNLF